MFCEELLKMPSSWEYMKESGLPVLLYGMGNGADMVLDELLRLNIPVCGVTASDDFVRGQSFRGYTVKKLDEFEDDCIIALCFGTRIPEVIERIKSLSQSRKVLVPVVPVCGSEIINREFIEKNSGEIDKAAELIEKESLECFENCIKFMFTGSLEYLFAAETGKAEILSGVMAPGGEECFLDIGAYRGDTVKEFLEFSGGKYGEIVAAEPDSKTFAKLEKNLENMKNVFTLNCAVGEKAGTVLFDSAAGRQSKISTKGREIPMLSIDGMYAEHKFTYIKIDAEGNEENILKGAECCIKQMKPKMNIALYHRSVDFFRLPLLLNSLNPEYRLFVGKHPYIPCWDFNLYAI